MADTLTKPKAADGVRWDLSDLFADVDDPTWGQALDQILGDAKEFAERYRGTINVAGGPSPAHLVEALTRYESVQEQASRAGAFPRLLHAADTVEPKVRELVNRADNFSTELRNHLLFFDLEWLEVPEDVAQRLMAAPELAGYAEYLRRERLFLPHKLSEAEEKIVNEKELTGRRAWTKLFSELTSSLTFPLEGNEKGTLAEAMARMYHPSRETRQQAHDALFDTMAKNSQVLTFTYDTLIQDHQTMDRLRKYPDPMHERHLTNNVPPEAVAQMMAVVEESYGIAHDYWRAKANMLDLDKLMTYDQYAPIAAATGEISWEDGRATVLDALREFHPPVAKISAEFFDRSWIDAEVRTGKRGGAFCAYPAPSVHPFVLCNFTGNRRDVMTVAHELGHGIHGQLARKQTLLNYHAPLPMAETASVFAEMLVFDHLMAAETNADVRRALVASQIENVFATTYRQNVLTRFEQGVFDARSKARLTTDRISDIWIEANAPYYGDALQMTEGYRYGWSYIPHFINTRFYCYAYTFGELLVLALYGLYREQGAAFIPGYVRALESGGSRPPADVLGDLGADIRDREFWRLGFNEIRRLVDSLIAS